MTEKHIKKLKAHRSKALADKTIRLFCGIALHESLKRVFKKLLCDQAH